MNKCLSYDEMKWQLNERLFVRGVSDPEDFKRWWSNEEHIKSCERCHNVYWGMIEHAESVSSVEGLVWDKYDEIYNGVWGGQQEEVDETKAQVFDGEGTIIGKLNLVMQKIENWSLSLKPVIMPIYGGGELGGNSDSIYIKITRGEGDLMRAIISLPPEIADRVQLRTTSEEVIVPNSILEKDGRKMVIFNSLAKETYTIVGLNVESEES